MAGATWASSAPRRGSTKKAISIPGLARARAPVDEFHSVSGSPVAHTRPASPSFGSYRASRDFGRFGRDFVDRASSLTTSSICNPVSIEIRRTTRWIHTARADIFFACWVILNALALALETDFRTDANQDHPIWLIIDSVFNVVFIFELCLHIEAEKKLCLCSGWNVLDASICIVGVLDSWILPLVEGLSSDLTILSFMRIVKLVRLARVLRVIRLVRVFKELMLLVAGIASAARAMVWGFTLLAVTIFICGLILTKLVGKNCCEDDDVFSDSIYADLFGNMARSSFTLFQFTMEFQPDICRETWNHNLGICLTLFLIVFTMFTNLTLLNILASVIIENVLGLAMRKDEEQLLDSKEKLLADAAKTIEKLFVSLDGDDDGVIKSTDLNTQDPAVRRACRHAGVSMDVAQDLFQILDTDQSGTVSKDEFVKGLVKVKLPPAAKDLFSIECHIHSLDRKIAHATTQTEERHQAILNALAEITQSVEHLQATVNAHPSDKHAEGGTGGGPTGIQRLGSDMTTASSTDTPVVITSTRVCHTR